MESQSGDFNQLVLKYKSTFQDKLYFQVIIISLMNSLTAEQNSNRPTSPGRSVVSRGTCLPGSTSRTCSRASPPCLYPTTASPPLRVWWSWSNSVEEPSPKQCGRQASASGGTAAEGPRAAGSCQSSGCLVRCHLFFHCCSMLIGSSFSSLLSTMWKFVYGLKTKMLCSEVLQCPHWWRWAYNFTVLYDFF